MVRLVRDRTFGQPQEGRIVEKLHRSCDELLSLVALANNHVVGHILFSPFWIEGYKVFKEWGWRQWQFCLKFREMESGAGLFSRPSIY